MKTGPNQTEEPATYSSTKYPAKNTVTTHDSHASLVGQAPPKGYCLDARNVKIEGMLFRDNERYSLAVSHKLKNHSRIPQRPRPMDYSEFRAE